MLFITVVLYNKSLTASDTLKGLLQSAELLKQINAHVLLWDNSSEAWSKEDMAGLSSKLPFEYVHSPENKPLSFIYNATIDRLLVKDSCNYLVILDDDSKIGIGYFRGIVNAVTYRNDLPILLPLVRNNNRIISPAKFYYFKGSYFKTLADGLYTGKLFAINSGMVISKKFLQQSGFKYDKRLTNYGTDNYLMNFANERKVVFYILQYSMEHSLSFFDHPDVSRRLEIFKQIKKANRIVFSNNLFQVLMINWYNFISSLKHAIKYRSLKFFS